MKNQNTEEIEGVVLETLPNTMFRVRLDDGRNILATLSGKLRRGFIRILPADRVKVEMTSYDKERGRIIFRYK